MCFAASNTAPKKLNDRLFAQNSVWRNSLTLRRHNDSSQLLSSASRVDKTRYCSKYNSSMGLAGCSSLRQQVLDTVKKARTRSYLLCDICIFLARDGDAYLWAFPPVVPNELGWFSHTSTLTCVAVRMDYSSPNPPANMATAMLLREFWEL